MRLQRSDDHLLVFSAGDEIPIALEKFAEENQIAAGSFSGIGALSSAVIAFFDLHKKEYVEIDLDEQLECLSMIGNVGRLNGTAKIHAHTVLSRPDGSVIGGHLVRATVRPTLEVFLTAYSEQITRRHNDEVGLPLIEKR